LCPFQRTAGHGQKKKGREPVAPPREAPRSAHAKDTPSRARWARTQRLAFASEISRFSREAVAEATLNCCQFFSIASFIIEPGEEYLSCLQSSKLACAIALHYNSEHDEAKINTFPAVVAYAA